MSYYKEQNRPTQYVFPILLNEKLTPEQIHYRKQKVLKTYNSRLKEIAELAKVDAKLTSYVARHSFATISKNERYIYRKNFRNDGTRRCKRNNELFKRVFK